MKIKNDKIEQKVINNDNNSDGSFLEDYLCQEEEIFHFDYKNKSEDPNYHVNSLKNIDQLKDILEKKDSQGSKSEIKKSNTIKNFHRKTISLGNSIFEDDIQNNFFEEYNKKITATDYYNCL